MQTILVKALTFPIKPIENLKIICGLQTPYFNWRVVSGSTTFNPSDILSIVNGKTPPSYLSSSHTGEDFVFTNPLSWIIWTILPCIVFRDRIISSVERISAMFQRSGTPIPESSLLFEGSDSEQESKSHRKALQKPPVSWLPQKQTVFEYVMIFYSSLMLLYSKQRQFRV
jgi:hypothetical protein